MPNRSMVVRCLGFMLTAAFLSGAAGSVSAQLRVSRFTVDGGGGTRSTGGSFAVGGTIGQPDAGRLSGLGFTLHGGFWLGGGGVSAVNGGDGPPAASPFLFRMYPASPNPLEGRTLLAFDLPAPAQARLALYDASGRLVRTIADEPLPAGQHQRTWDRRDRTGQPVVSGIYFLRLDAGPNQGSQKLTVVH